MVRAEYDRLITQASADPAVDSSDSPADASKDATPKPLSLDAILSDASDSATAYVDAARAYASRLGADGASAPDGHAFVNGKHFNFDDEFWRSMQAEGQAQLQHLQETVRMPFRTLSFSRLTTWV